MIRLRRPATSTAVIENVVRKLGGAPILGTDIRQLGLRFTLDTAMLGVGGLMGIRIATSCMLGAFINFAVLAPLMIQHGDIKAYTDSAGVLVPISRGEIVNQWSLWWGVAMMVVGSMVSLFARPEIFVNAFRSMRKRERTGPDVLGHIELPLWLSFVGVPVFSVLGAAATHYFFGVPWLLAFVSLPLIFVLTALHTKVPYARALSLAIFVLSLVLVVLGVQLAEL